MCELFGLSARLPTAVTVSMRALVRHGSQSRHLGDGWGVAFHAGDDALLIKQPEGANDSPGVDFLETRRIRGRTVIAHIRRATQGEISLRNTQPFSRELGGRMHVFAHNGKLPGIELGFASAFHRFQPVGSTDSEVAFCVLLERLAPLWEREVPSPATRVDIGATLARELREPGPANFLYSDGELLIAHGHRRTQGDNEIAPPGLVTLSRCCMADPDALSSAGVQLHESQYVTLFASVPLTDESWRPLGEGEIVTVSSARPVRQ